MARLAQTPGLTDVQRDDPGDRAGVRRQGDHPARAAARARRRVPGRHRRRHARDGAVRADHRRGVRRARRVAAHLRAGGRGAVPGLDVDLRHRQHPLHRRVPDRPARLRRAEGRGCCRGWPPARCAARSPCPSRAAAPTSRRSGRRADARRRRLRPQRTEDVADQRRVLLGGRHAGQDRQRRRVGLRQHDHVPAGEGARLRRDRARPDHPRQASRRWATRASRPPRWCSTA